MKRAVDIAYRAKGFSEKLHQEGFIRCGDIVRETRERILSLETENYQESVITAILETAEVNPESISEVEILPEGSPGEWCIHVQPEQSWFAVVHYLTGQMRGDRPGNPTVARQRLQPGGTRPNF